MSENFADVDAIGSGLMKSPSRCRPVNGTVRSVIYTAIPQQERLY